MMYYDIFLKDIKDMVCRSWMMFHIGIDRFFHQDLVPQLTQLYVTTIALPIRMHLFIVDGIGSVAAR